MVGELVHLVAEADHLVLETVDVLLQLFDSVVEFEDLVIVHSSAAVFEADCVARLWKALDVCHLEAISLNLLDLGWAELVNSLAIIEEEDASLGQRSWRNHGDLLNTLPIDNRLRDTLSIAVLNTHDVFDLRVDALDIAILVS